MFNENKENIIYAKENSIISFSIYFFIERDFEKVKEVKNVEDSYDIEVEYDIEDIIYSDIDIVIKGWLVQIGSNNKYINRSILLKGDDGTIISIKTEAENRSDLAEKNTSETIYNKCGLIGRVKKDKLDKGKKYQVGFMIINQDEKEEVIFTNEVIEIS
ncbi:hypothetical protein [uncultured Clostridium sp.]|uniref:hypothetical protein n=1 Tax=uncultured Clostridium sp. TaxID=59620 RepID=UPI00266F88DA|nr:hypothetical protein [uncultured Clostridium sp.]